MKDVATYRKVYELAPGIYKIEIGLTDNKSGNKGFSAIAFQIPKAVVVKN
jgi:hypothetical protein